MLLSIGFLALPDHYLGVLRTYYGYSYVSNCYSLAVPKAPSPGRLLASSLKRIPDCRDRCSLLLNLNNIPHFRDCGQPSRSLQTWSQPGRNPAKSESSIKD